MFFYIYKLYLISAEGYKNATVDLFRIKKMAKCGKKKVLQDGLDAQNIFDLLLKEIYSIDKTKSLTKDQIEKYKITKKKNFEKFDDLSEDELNAKSNKDVYAKNDVMTTVIKRCRGEQKKRPKKNRCI